MKPFLHFVVLFLVLIVYGIHVSTSSQSFVFEDLLSEPKYEVKIGSELIANSSLARILGETTNAASLNEFHDGVSVSTTQPAINSPGDPSTTALDDRILLAEDTKEVEAPPEVIVMRSGHGQRFVCSIPEAKPPSRKEVEEKEDRHELEKRAVVKGLQLLEALKNVNGNDCLYYIQGWWTYEYCHLRFVRQFHQEGQSGLVSVPAYDDESVYWLGRFESFVPPTAQGTPAQAAVRTTMQSNGNRNYLRQFWGGGTECDLTHKPRRIEIQFHCNMQAQERIEFVMETSVCHYRLVIHTPRLCQDPIFSSSSNVNVNYIQCNPVVSDVHYETEKKRLLDDKKDEPVTGENKNKAGDTKATANDDAPKLIENSVTTEKKKHEDEVIVETDTLGENSRDLSLVMELMLKLATERKKPEADDKFAFSEVRQTAEEEYLVDESMTKEGAELGKVKAEADLKKHQQPAEQRTRLSVPDIVQFLKEQGLREHEPLEQRHERFAPAEQEQLSKRYETVYDVEDTENRKKDEL